MPDFDGDGIPDEPYESGSRGLESAFPQAELTQEMDPVELLRLIRGETKSPAPTSVREGSAVAVSESGHDSATYEKLARDKRPEAAQARARMEEEEKARKRVAEMRAYGDKYGQAIKSEGAAAGALAEAERRGQADLSTFTADRAREEERAVSESRAEANSIKADFQRQLAEYRAMRVNPNKIFDEQTTGQRVGTLASVFVADFLGAKGIKTSVMDTINRAIDRSVDAQKANVDIQGKALEGTQSLWQMQRQQSQSDEEARARVRTLMLQSFKDEVESKLGAYESGLASAKAQSALAKIDVELVNSINQVNFHADQNANARAQEIGTMYRARVEAAHRSKMLKLEQDKFEQTKLAAAAKKGENQVLDVTRSGGNRIIGNLVRGSEIEHRDLRKQINNFAKIETVLARAQEWRNKHGPVADYIGNTRFVDEADRTYTAMIENLASQIVYERTGAASAEAERETLRRLIPKDTWLTNGGTEQPYAALRQHYRDQINAQLAQYTDNPNVAVGSPDTGYAGIDPGGYTADRAILLGNNKPVDDSVSKSIGVINDRTGSEADKDVLPDSLVAKEWQDFGASGAAPANFGKENFFDRDPDPRKESDYTSKEVPKWASSMSNLAQEIEFFQRKQQTPGDEGWEQSKARAERALNELVRHATDFDTGTGTQSQEAQFEAAYAQYLLLKLGADPGQDPSAPTRQTAPAQPGQP